MDKFSIKNYLFEQSKQRGVSLILTFFIMVIILVVVLVVSNLAYSQIKVIRNIGNSVISFYAADSGVEKLLFFDKQVIITGAKRGLCSMVDPTSIGNPYPCIPDPAPASGSDHSIYCNPAPPDSLKNELVTGGCAPDICNNCTIIFSTKISSVKNYTIKATITPSAGGETNDLNIAAYGSNENVSRAVNIFITKAVPQQIITVVSASATPVSIPSGTAINIQAEAQSPNGVSLVDAYIKNAPDSATWTTVHLTCDSGFADRVCAGTYVAAVGAHYVDIYVKDGHNIEYTDKNIPQAGQIPSFEVYSFGGTSYPAVSTSNVSKSGNNVTMTATATDVSGVLALVAKIKKSGGGVADVNVNMQPIVGSGCDQPNPSSPCGYAAIVDVSSYTAGTYTVDLTTTDNLLNTNPSNIYSNIGGFTK